MLVGPDQTLSICTGLRGDDAATRAIVTNAYAEATISLDGVPPFDRRAVGAANVLSGRIEELAPSGARAHVGGGFSKFGSRS